MMGHVRRLLMLLLLATATCTFAQDVRCPPKGSPAPHPSGRLRLATWNLENLHAQDGQSISPEPDPSVKRTATDAFAWREAGSHVEGATHPEVDHPLVDRLTSDLQAGVHLCYALPLVAPQQGLSPTEELGSGGMSGEPLRHPTLLG
jgi:hypothetical protein